MLSKQANDGYLQKEREAFEATSPFSIYKDKVNSDGNKYTPIYYKDLDYAQIMNFGWLAWQAAKAQSVSEGRTDFEIINQTLELVDLIALSTNVFQRDPKSKVHPFESENPRVMEWWRTACQIQELLTNTDSDNCDFEEYKAMIEALEPAND